MALLQTNSYETVEVDNDLIQLVTIYYDNPVVFAEQILGIQCDDQQQIVLNSLVNKKWVTVRSGRGAGKTWCSSMAIWWFLCTRYNAQIYITAPSSGTLSTIWATLTKLYQNMNPIFKDQFEITALSIKHTDPELAKSWFCMQRTARREQPDAMAGTHNKNMLYVIEEASGVDDSICNIIENSLTEDENYLLVISNPRKINGYFWETHQPKRSLDFAQCKMSVINNPRVTEEFIKSRERLYGADSNSYRIEVLGEFPKTDNDVIIPWDVVEEAINRKGMVPSVKEPIYWGVDFGAGSDESVLVKRQGNVVFNDVKFWNEKDAMIVVGKIAEEYLRTTKAMRPKKIFVDNVSIGHGAYYRLKELKLPVFGADSRGKAVLHKYYYSCKMEWWIAARDWFRDQEAQLPNIQKLVDQLTSVKSVVHSDGRLKVESKDDYRKRTLKKKSPDAADAMILTFVGDVVEMPQILFF